MTISPLLKEIENSIAKLTDAEKLWLIEQIVRQLRNSPNEQTKQSNVNLDETTQIDYSDTWTPEDQLELATFSLQYATNLYSD